MARKLVLILFLGIAALSVATAAALIPQANSPRLDGRIMAGEYSELGSLNGMEFGASLSKDGILTLALKAPTAGWVAIGLGSGFMDGSWILMAYEEGGRQAFSEQLGISHFHRPVRETKILAKAVRYEGGYTTLEFQVRASDFVKDGQLPVIMAFGRSPDFISYHERHARTLLSF